MARRRFQNLDPERREAILAAAGEEFAERGYAGASLARIIDAAGISKGTLYYYFEDKADLFGTAIEVAVERWLEATGGLRLSELEPAEYWTAIREAAQRTIGMMTEDAWYVRLALAFPRLREEPEAGAAVQPMLEWGRRYTEGFLARGQELGVVRRDLPLDLLVEIMMAVDEAGDRWLSRRAQEYDEAKLRRLLYARLDLVQDMLAAEKR